MRHLIIFVVIMIALMESFCSNNNTDASSSEDTTMIELLIGTNKSTVELANSVMYDNADKTKKTIQVKPIEDNRSFYERGYDEGYDNGREDGTMDMGDGYSYCDANPYKGAAKRGYECGYKRGYRKGYNEGFYEYSDGDEEDYDEY